MDPRDALPYPEVDDQCDKLAKIVGQTDTDRHRRK